MSQDGKPQQILRKVRGSSGGNFQKCEHGEFYIGAHTLFARCTGKHVHCKGCGGVAKKFGRTFTCNCGSRT